MHINPTSSVSVEKPDSHKTLEVLLLECLGSEVIVPLSFPRLKANTESCC